MRRRQTCYQICYQTCHQTCYQTCHQTCYQTSGNRKGLIWSDFYVVWTVAKLFLFCSFLGDFLGVGGRGGMQKWIQDLCSTGNKWDIIPKCKIQGFTCTNKFLIQIEDLDDRKTIILFCTIVIKILNQKHCVLIYRRNLNSPQANLTKLSVNTTRRVHTNKLTIYPNR